MPHLDTALPGRDAASGDPHTYSTLDGTVRICIHVEDEDYSIDVKTSGYNPKSLAETITQADFWGLEVMDEDEAPGELIEDESGTWIRLWLAAKAGSL